MTNERISEALFNLLDAACLGDMTSDFICSEFDLIGYLEDETLQDEIKEWYKELCAIDEAKEIEAKERKELARLLEKYGGFGG